VAGSTFLRGSLQHREELLWCLSKNGVTELE
jgi:hypothetical protein